MSAFLWKKICIRAVGLAFLVLLLTVGETSAHNVTIFAWVEGDTIYTESKFSGGRVAKEAPIEVYDAAGVKLLSGKSDQNGEFSFKIPKKEDLKIVLKAGMGHGNEWVVTAEEIAEAQGETASAATAPEPSEPAEKAAEPAPSFGPQVTAGAAPIGSQADLEKLLDKKLAPVLKKLSHLEAKQKTGPGFSEIIGGIGYILGLMGLAAYIQSKRKGNG